ncbi:hypothetical protein BCR33DRAFT_846198 [Rhizoclosmatium globosum]|uniref:Uncharacterized protein n=1 Tax=Rhizoclosmatium globosum TaxID=329046 RepID=A0A1Y2CWH6_9FUNG|nr:hypothetical protein BCR33DRAFT_846198 [Rhizoclosmatium globosum]|eukprot:ORY51389.1 hypothetical protein BCR33DRAFT_846198 [Rhizoclosmatium globosum]
MYHSFVQQMLQDRSGRPASWNVPRYSVRQDDFEDQQDYGFPRMTMNHSPSRVPSHDVNALPTRGRPYPLSRYQGLMNDLKADEEMFKQAGYPEGYLYMKQRRVEDFQRETQQSQRNTEKEMQQTGEMAMKDTIMKELMVDKIRDEKKFELLAQLLNKRRQAHPLLALSVQLAHGKPAPPSEDLVSLLHENTSIEFAIMDIAEAMLSNKKRANRLINSLAYARKVTASTDQELADEEAYDKRFDDLIAQLLQDDVGSKLLDAGALNEILAQYEHNDQQQQEQAPSNIPQQKQASKAGSPRGTAKESGSESGVSGSGKDRGGTSKK